MDSGYPRISEHRGCSPCCEPSMVADRDRKDQKKIADVSGRFLILAADGKFTVNTIQYKVFDIVCVELRDLLVQSSIDI